MRHIMTAAVAGGLALGLLAGPAHAATGVGGAPADTASTTTGLVLDVDEATLDHALDSLAATATPAEAQAVLEQDLGQDAVARLANEVGASSGALFGGTVAAAQTMKKKTFMQCMKSSVGKDIRSIFKVNAIATLIGKEKYVEAAKAAVKYLAKQGIKRNAAGLAATLAWYAVKCKF